MTGAPFTLSAPGTLTEDSEKRAHVEEKKGSQLSRSKEQFAS